MVQRPWKNADSTVGKESPSQRGTTTHLLQDDDDYDDDNDDADDQASLLYS